MALAGPRLLIEKDDPMDAEDFRQMALSLDGAEEGSHMGAPDFRVGGHIFATLAMQHLGCGNLMLSPALQHVLIAETPKVFFPIPGGWGKMGCTHIRLADASAQQMLKGLQLAWNLRVEKNSSSRSSRPRRGRGKP
jgi:hypothetical protein